MSTSEIRFNRSLLLSSVVQVMLSWDEEPALAARRLDSLLRRTTPPELMRLESDYRSRRYSLGSLGLRAPGDAVPDRYAVALAALMSFDRSGYVREEGVAKLADAPESFPVPFLLLRLNDPVAEVRNLAQSALATRLAPEHVAFLVQALPLLDSLTRRRRASPLLTVVEDLLHRGGTEALWQGARSADPLMRACCLRWLARIEPVAAVETAFASRDPSLWRWATRVATSSRLTPAERNALLPCLENSSSPRIRLRALHARARQQHGETELRRAMLDRDARVRYYARATLYARGYTNLAPQVYRDALASPDAPDSIVIGALGGLSDLGGACDVPRVLDFVTHRKARIRAEAWRTLGVLAPQEVDRRAAQLADDPSGKVRRHLPNRAASGVDGINTGERSDR
ncbi:hypothetical protein [Streptomyces sp. SID13726]|uniref:hypothetical protein n=1 Tax=Streptomyces sp. SID13726 TaxID=2706058 RepID=UPI0013B7B857|nr:hypothetical protein [Streptomyces sp. SID13726]NEB03247.1 hypothetical protein [Streptomyces sp. SID13726]